MDQETDTNHQTELGLLHVICCILGKQISPLDTLSTLTGCVELFLG